MKEIFTLNSTVGGGNSYKWIEMQPKQSTIDFIMHFAATYDTKRTTRYATSYASQFAQC